MFNGGPFAPFASPMRTKKDNMDGYYVDCFNYESLDVVKDMRFDEAKEYIQSIMFEIDNVCDTSFDVYEGGYYVFTVTERKDGTCQITM